jgi:uncharacterized NAD(P)/FAD-binding protein YdhS
VIAPGPSGLRVVIVGGGASGTLLAAELLRQPQAVEVTLVEPRAALGRGVAYSTPHFSHLLNVRAGRMSGDADDPGHFLRWLSRHDPSAHEGTFAPRALYGRYLQALLDETRAASAPGSRLAHVPERVVEVEPCGPGFRVLLGDGSSLEADAVVLALGNLPPAGVPLLPTGGADPKRFVVDPWSPQAFEGIALDEPVLLVGTGLTSVDVVLALRDMGHRARVLAVSRRGMLPRTQAAVQPPLILPTAAVSPAPFSGVVLPRPAVRRSVRLFTRAVRAEVERLGAAGGDWHTLFEALRPLTPALWSDLPWDERRRFLRHLQPYWDAHRHRMAPEVADQIQKQIRSGALVVRAARVRGFGPDPNGVRVTLAPRGGAKTEEIVVGAVVSCTGPGSITAARHPLLRSLIAQGLVRPDPLGLGLAAAPDGALLAGDGSKVGGLYALGPLLKGELWETTAVPEIRSQAKALAHTLVALGRALERARTQVAPGP